ncbi:MAG: arginine--tRNA ligase [Flavobacteriales bacterium]|nr:arginine--tRNA ligase [Flavobacteriales bacterium]
MIETILHKKINEILINLYGDNDYSIQFQSTRKEFEGDITLVVFPFTRFSKLSPEITAQKIGELLAKLYLIDSFSVIKGFLNLVISNKFWLSEFSKSTFEDNYGFVDIDENSPNYLVEYCSPNTNKPIHLGHIRNNLLGFSLANILKASGKNVKKVQIINDRGIHICKSMIAWQEFGEDESPESSGLKGDHLVGKYYVMFDKQYKTEVAELIEQGIESKLAEEKAPILLKAKEMLLKWEAKDKEVIALWKKMNLWVYDGFEMTYKRLGVDFDKNYYESETYLLGKEVVKNGLDSGVFYKKEDGSVWIDLSSEGLDEKIILRSDGTAVYMTQDIGTAIKRHEDFNFSHMTYTVGNEQDYHFKVLFLILEKLGYSWAKSCYHLSYGMVDLPNGKMKSREGTAVDADDLMEDMFQNAKSIAEELGKIDKSQNNETNELYETVGMGALKYFMLKVDPKKRMLFDPQESIDFNGNTGPFIQYTYARIQSILRKNNGDIKIDEDSNITDKERALIISLLEFPKTIQEAANSFSPALIANYVYEVVKDFNSYYQSTSILGADSPSIISFRVALSQQTAKVIKSSMSLLGISVPQRM